jgi:DNA helicase-2/ATP-dependent DNA helicase PcrA
MDFDDLLFYTWILFQKHPDVLARYREQFRYVLVDEYQDTNYAQHSIVQQLAGEHQHICVVGDDAQSIYSFRGADIDNILYFTKIYPNTRVFKLEQNYRSTQTIVCAANSLIEKNQRQIRKEVFSEKERGEAIGVFQAYSDVEEGDIVINKIKDLRRRHDYEYSDFAILYRTNAQSRIFEETLRKNGMPYKIYGGLSFYQRKEIKDVVAYFRVTVNPADEEAFKRIINYPARGIGDTTLGKIIEAATGNNTSLWNVLCDPLAYQLSINKGTHTKLQEFRELIESFRDRLVTDNAYQIGTDIIRRSGIMTDIHADNSPESLSRQENIEELVNGLQDFCALRMEEGSTDISLSDYLSDIALLTDQDSDKDNEGAKVVLMTVHSAKGLEFRNVFVVGMEENLFPGSMAGDSPRAMEEERRLFYVAITRAEEHCYLSYARTRFRYGKMEFGTPSRFLRDIDTCFLDLPHEAGIGHKVDEGAARFRKEEVRQQIRPRAQVIAPTLPRNLKKVANSSTENQSAQSMQTSLGELRVGQNIQHERFGMGEVTKLEGSGDNAKATIRFRHAGEKQLLLRFARFTVID